MITAKKLAAAALAKGLELHQNLTVGRTKIYCVTRKGERIALKAGGLGEISDYIGFYQSDLTTTPAT